MQLTLSSCSLLPKPLPPLLFSLLLLLLQPPPSTSILHNNNRRILHHPLFPSSSIPPSEPPHISPHHPQHYPSNPKLPFTSSITPAPPPTPITPSDAAQGDPFFPTFPSSSPTPLPPATPTLPTFPSNISSLALPSSTTSSDSYSFRSGKLIVGLLIVAVFFVALSFFAVFLRRRTGMRSGELRPLYPSHTPTSDGRPPPKLPNTHVSQTSSEFLYMGTVAECSEFQQVHQPPPSVEGASEGCHSGRVYHLKLCGGSPELKPLPPLPKHSFQLYSREQHMFREDGQVEGGVSGTRGEQFFVDEEFFSPSISPRHADGDEGCFDNDNSAMRSSCFSSSYGESPGKDSDVSVEIQSLAEKKELFPPPPPPPPIPRQWVSSGSGLGPPPLVPPSGPVVLKRSGERKEEGMTMKPKLKALYWDKVGASSDRVMVWDQLHPCSFQLNEEMIETLFTANGTIKDGARRSIMPLLNENYRVLDPKKSQNIAILLKALSVTEKEVCEALLEGNGDALGTELLESLLKMTPTKEEERKLLVYNDQSPMKLGPAEKFLKAMLDVPFAFKRVDAMLYIATFDAEVEYLKKSFETLEVACEQLRKSRMFLKLLEAVLKTGNRMNVGTNRGDAEAFKLDTLLKLVDIKGTDRKTTLLHFVVQEIIKAEGSRLSHTNQPTAHDNIEQRKRGLEVVASLGGELMNVKKAAAMDSDALSMDVTRLARGVIKINEVLQLNEENGMTVTGKRFRESLTNFLTRAEMEIVRIQSQESSLFCRVRELTEYFHGNLAREEAHPLRIFMVVRDFLGVLDQVCKEVGKINERTIISSTRSIPSSVNPTLQPPFPEFNSTGGEDSSSTMKSTIRT